MAWFTGEDYDHKASLSDLNMLKRFWKYMAPYKWALAAGLGLAPFMGWLGIYFWLVVKQIVDIALPKGDVAMLTRFCLILTGAITLSFLVNYIQSMLNEWVGQRITRDMRKDVFNHLIRQNHTFFDANPIGKITTRVTNDIENLGNFFAAGAISLVTDLVKLVMISAILLQQDVHLTLILLPFMGVITVIVEVFRRRLRESSREIREGIARINGFLQEHVSGALTVQLYGQQERVQDNFDKFNKGYFKAFLSNIRQDATLYAMVEWSGMIVAAAVLWFGGGAGLQQLVTIGTLILFIQLLDQFFQPIRDLSTKYAVIQSAFASLEKIFGLLDEDNTVKTPEPLKPIAPPQGRLIFDKVNFTYPQGKQVIENVSFQVASGEKIALVGHTGSGKSTLFKLLLRFYEPDSGLISMDGVPLNRISPLDLYSVIGMVSQDIQIFEGTLYENLTLQNPVFGRAEVEQRLRRFEADTLFPGLFERLDSHVQAEGRNFSVGEKQILSILRAMLYNPSLVLLDEATASVDSHTEERVQKALMTLFQGRTVLVIAHRLATVKACDRLIVMHHGKIAEQGSHPELLEKDGLYARLYRLQFSQTALTGS